jgi:hypothetical protein
LGQSAKRKLTEQMTYARPVLALSMTDSRNLSDFDNFASSLLSHDPAAIAEYMAHIVHPITVALSVFHEQSGAPAVFLVTLVS